MLMLSNQLKNKLTNQKLTMYYYLLEKIKGKDEAMWEGFAKASKSDSSMY